MGQDVALRCRCGEIEGLVSDASAETVNRIVCYCDDCQAYAHHLGRADLLDAHGGTDIVQVAPASLTFQRGAERIAGLHLRPRGLYRWYATCCSTPLGNTAAPALPFVGIVATAFEVSGHPNALFGKPVGGILGKFAVGTAPAGSTGLNVRVLGRAVRMVLGWRLRGKSWPHPYFERATGAAKYPLTTLSPEQRESLRPLCGPR